MAGRVSSPIGPGAPSGLFGRVKRGSGWAGPEQAPGSQAWLSGASPLFWWSAAGRPRALGVQFSPESPLETASETETLKMGEDERR